MWVQWVNINEEMKNKPSSLFTSDRNGYNCRFYLKVFSLKNQIFYPHTWVHNTYPTFCLQAPELPIHSPFHSATQTQAGLSPLWVLVWMLENEFQLRNLPKTTEIKIAKMTVTPSHHLQQWLKALSLEPSSSTFIGHSRAKGLIRIHSGDVGTTVIRIKGLKSVQC